VKLDQVGAIALGVDDMETRRIFICEATEFERLRRAEILAEFRQVGRSRIDASARQRLAQRKIGREEIDIFERGRLVEGRGFETARDFRHCRLALRPS